MGGCWQHFADLSYFSDIALRGKPEFNIPPMPPSEQPPSQRRALVSVSDKKELGPFATALIREHNFEVVSTGGTRRELMNLGLPITDVAEYTGFPEMMDGRVKTLHPKVHGGLLRRDNVPADLQSMKEHGILPFELVVCNLYPFEATIAKPGSTMADAVENIDIGGPSMLRSAAKSSLGESNITVVTSPEQYALVLEELARLGSISAETRKKLAIAAFDMTRQYDDAIYEYLRKQSADL